MYAKGMVAVRWFSLTNEWIDCVVVVPEYCREQAKIAMRSACDKFWDDEYETVGDAVCGEFDKEGIPYTAILLPWDYKRDRPLLEEEVWEQMISELPEVIVVN